MAMFAWAVLGIALGAVGSEVLREKKPNLIKNVEDAAKRLVDSVCASKKKEKNSKAPTE